MKYSLFEINRETFGDLKRSLFLVHLFEICNNHQKSQIWINGNKSYIYMVYKISPKTFLDLRDTVLVTYMCSGAFFNYNSFMWPNKKGLIGKEIISFTNLSSLLILLNQINDFGNWYKVQSPGILWFGEKKKIKTSTDSLKKEWHLNKQMRFNNRICSFSCANGSVDFCKTTVRWN